MKINRIQLENGERTVKEQEITSDIQAILIGVPTHDEEELERGITMRHEHLEHYERPQRAILVGTAGLGIIATTERIMNILAKEQVHGCEIIVVDDSKRNFSTPREHLIQDMADQLNLELQLKIRPIQEEISDTLLFSKEQNYTRHHQQKHHYKKEKNIPTKPVHHPRKMMQR